MGVMRHVPTPEPHRSLEQRLAAYLGERRRHVRRARADATDESRRILRLAAKGRVEVNEETLTRVAAALEDDLHPLAAARAPLTAVTEGLAIGGHRVGFRRGQSRAALVAYLELIDAVAARAADPTPFLRTDIGLLRGMVGADPVALIHRIGHHFDFARETREAMVRLHRTGATTIGFRCAAGPAVDRVVDQLNWPTPAPGQVPLLAAAASSPSPAASATVPAHWWDERATAAVHDPR